ncbi:MAG: hypothetical protein RIC15_06190 [Vicingaceae bacterium]
MRKILLLAFIAASFTACNYFIAPPYTSVNELIKVRKGMTITKVNEVLGIQPYDLYNVQDDGGTILVYNYRIKDRKMKVPGMSYKQREKVIKSERGQKEGIEWYAEASRVYILFEDDKVASLITDHGREDAEWLMITNNNLQLIAKEDLVNLKYSHADQDLLIMKGDGTVGSVAVPKNTEDDQTLKSIFLPVKKENTKSVAKQKRDEKGGKSFLPLILIGGGALLLLLIL